MEWAQLLCTTLVLVPYAVLMFRRHDDTADAQRISAVDLRSSAEQIIHDSIHRYGQE